MPFRSSCASAAMCILPWQCGNFCELISKEEAKARRLKMDWIYMLSLPHVSLNYARDLVSANTRE